MLNKNKLIFTTFTYLLLIINFNAYAFVSPSLQQQTEEDFDSSFKRTQKLRKFDTLIQKDLDAFNIIISGENSQFFGYHGDSLDFYIFQDILRYIIEDIVGISIKPNFHFLATPLDPSLKIQSKEKLAEIFKAHTHQVIVLSDSTFPLNFTLWGNLDRQGVNTLEHYMKNESVKPRGYERRLKWLFNRLGINENQISTLFTFARSLLPSSKGVILQFFDESKPSYKFLKEIAYPAYPNGFIAANKTIDEYYTDEYSSPYPHEIRLLLKNKETLNPNSSLKIKRHTPELSELMISNYQKALKKKIGALTYSKFKRNSYKKELSTVWNLNSK